MRPRTGALLRRFVTATPLPAPSPRVQQLVQQGMTAQRAGDLAGAARAFAEALRLEPRRYDLLHLMGMTAVAAKDWVQAVDCFRRAARLAPHLAPLQINLANALVDSGRFVEAVEAADRVIAQGDLADAWNARGAALKGLGLLNAATDSYRRAAAVQPPNPGALCNLGALLANMGSPLEGLDAFDRAIAAAPNFAEAFSGRARVRLLLGKTEEALADAERALTLRPNLAEAWANRGFALETLGRSPEAAQAYERSLALDPDLPNKLITRGIALSAGGRLREASICFESALALDETLAAAHLRLAQCLIGGDPAAMLKSLLRAIELEPDLEEARCLLPAAAMPCCDWRYNEASLADMQAAVRGGRPAVAPFAFLTVSASSADQRRCAETWARRHFPPWPKPLAASAHANPRIRVGYVSADFHNHATAWLTAAVFESHDRSQFETYAFSTHVVAEDEMRARLRRGFDHFVDVANLDEGDAAQAIRNHQIDILIDLKGYTANGRMGIFAARPAPVQAQWLGYPGTLGAEYIDYVIADSLVVPPGDERHFSEAVVRLPHSYQPNDPTRRIGPTPTRAQAGLPHEGMVFCCFNAAHKLTPPMFDIWMRLLSGVEGSVLWLLHDNDAARDNLRREAAARGVDPDRLVFAPRLGQADHLGRLRLADLVVDTLPYGAHTTASDALWAGVPVLTCRGEAFPGRVGASVLTAAGLPDLITESLGDYEALALALAGDPKRLAGLRARLAESGATSALFDAARFTRHLESALTTMHRRKLENRASQGFDVAPVG